MESERAKEVPLAVNAGEAASDSKVSAEKGQQMWTMEEAFDGLCEPRKTPNSPIPTGIGIINDTAREELNLERGIRSVAFLLDYMSEDGNTSVDGSVAQGLMECLHYCASEASRLRKWHTA
jgi:hypothetical protein